MTKQPTYPDYIGETYFGEEYQEWELDDSDGRPVQIRLYANSKVEVWILDSEGDRSYELESWDAKDIIVDNNLVSEDGESLLDFLPFKK